MRIAPVVWSRGIAEPIGDPACHTERRPYTLRHRVVRVARADALATRSAPSHGQAMALRAKVRRVPRPPATVKRQRGPTYEPSGKGTYWLVPGARPSRQILTAVNRPRRRNCYRR